MKINYFLAILAVVAGVSAAFTHQSERNQLYPTRKFESARINGERVHFITAHHLADLLYEKEPVTILDAREKKAYEAYHIPTARPYDAGLAVSGDQDAGLVVFYGMAGEENIYTLANEVSGKVYVLKGGLEAWYSLVLFPDMLEHKIRNADQLRYIVRRAGFFGGQAQNTQLLNLNVRESRFREGC
jgi:rhodanese-related sulfurtransferase